MLVHMFFFLVTFQTSLKLQLFAATVGVNHSRDCLPINSSFNWLYNELNGELIGWEILNGYIYIYIHIPCHPVY